MGLLDFFSPEAGQRRTAALGGLVDRAEYYVPPELRSILNFAGEMSPVAGLQRAGQASERMLDPSRTGGQRFGDLGEMLSETAGVAAPMAVAGRAGMPVAKAIQEGLLGFSAGADDVGRRVLDRLNQPGPVPTMYSNPLGGAKPKSITAYHGGTGDVTNAAGGRGAWFSENKDLADEYAFGGGSVNQFNISPERPIEFLHAEQRRPIGDIISTAVENSGDLSDETIAAARGKISALQERYGDEKRPLFEYWNNDPDIADLFRTLGYDSISVAEKSGGPQTWAALTPDIISSAPKATQPGLLSIPEQTAKPTPSRPLNPAEQMAKGILDMRAAGRAGEVTDEMMAQADPQYMFANTPLPMDYESRMARAGDFTPALHGTGADITAVDPSFFGNGQDLLGTGFYTTTAPSRADRYVPRKKTPSIERSKEYAEGGNIMPLMVREQNPFMLDQPIGNAANEIADIYAEDPFFNVERMSSGVNIVRGADNNSVMLDPYQQRHWALQNMRKSYGPSDTSDVLSEAGYSGVSGPESSGNRVRLAYEPTDIRSRFARFDPEFKHLRNLSAGVGGMGLLGMSYPQEGQY